MHIHIAMIILIFKECILLFFTYMFLLFFLLNTTIKISFAFTLYNEFIGLSGMAVGSLPYH
jgi:hypothetical protein